MFICKIINLFVNQRDSVGQNLLKVNFENGVYWFYSYKSKLKEWNYSNNRKD